MNLESINLICEDEQSQAKNNVARKEKNIDKVIKDGEPLEDDTFEDYMDTEPLEEEDDETNGHYRLVWMIF